MRRVSKRVGCMGQGYDPTRPAAIARRGGRALALALAAGLRTGGAAAQTMAAQTTAGQTAPAQTAPAPPPPDAPLICVLVPHFKDEYWLSVAWGLSTEAARLGARLHLAEAGGYRARQTQIAQLDDCAARRADAVLIGTVTSDHPDLLATVARVAQDRPVLALVNRLDAPDLAGRVGVDWREMGAAAGRTLAERHPAGSAPQRALFITGPAEAGWSAPVEQGLRAALAGSAVTVVARAEADTGLRAQFAAVAALTEAHPEADYLIGPAPAIEAAMGLAAAAPDRPHPALVATYVSHTIRRGLMAGTVLAAPFDDPVTQGAEAARLAVAAARPGTESPPPAPLTITLMTARDPALATLRLSPADWFPHLP